MANVLGKRYMCESCGTEVLCNKAGTGAFECCDTEMKLKEAKRFPRLINRTGSRKARGRRFR